MHTITPVPSLSHSRRLSTAKFFASPRARPARTCVGSRQVGHGSVLWRLPAPGSGASNDTRQASQKVCPHACQTAAEG